LEPIFEADFQPGSFGYRPKRTAHDAVDRVARAIVQQVAAIVYLLPPFILSRVWAKMHGDDLP